MSADGYLNFDTLIDLGGFKKGLKGLKTTFLSSAADMKAAFDMVTGAINRVTSSFAQMTAAYQTQVEAEARLAATMKNATGATDEQIQSVKDLAGTMQSLGVVGDEVQLAGAQELATYVESVDAIKHMLPVLNDMIAQQYGFSASTDSAVTIATMLGKVLQGQTSALSRYGYSFDAAQEQLLKFGTEEQRVATLAAVVEQSVAGANKALADTPTGRVKQLSNDFADLQETLGKLLVEIVYPLVTKLDVIVRKLNEITLAAYESVKALLGVSDDFTLGGAAASSDDMENSSEETADNFADIAKSAKDAEKANKGSLAAFDELNVISQDIADAQQEDTPALLGGAEYASLPEGLDISGFEKQVDAAVEIFKNKLLEIKERAQQIGEFLAPITDALKKNFTASVKTAGIGIDKFLSQYSGSLEKYSERVSTNLTSAARSARNGTANILNEAALSTQRTSEALSQGYADILTGAGVFALSFADVFASKLAIVSEDFEKWTTDSSLTIGDFFDSLSGGAALAMTTFGAILEDIGSRLTQWWEGSGSAAFGNLTDAFFSLQTALLEFWTSYLQPFVDYIVSSFGQLWDEHLGPLWSSVLELLSSVSDLIAGLWNGILSPFWNFIKRFADDDIETLKSIWDVVTDVFGVVADVIRGIIRMAQGLLDFITGIFTGDIEKAFLGFTEFVHGICIAIWGIIKGALNIIIDAVNAVWSSFYSVIREIINTIGSAVETIGDAVGLDWGFSLPDSVPKIPRLATGTVIPASYGEFTAILGDNKREPEVVSPLSTIEQALENVLARRGDSSGDIVVQIDGREVFRATQKQARSWSRTHGGRSAFA